MANFDDTSGIVPCVTAWGHWYQTMEEIFIQLDLPDGSKAKDIKCTFKNSYLSVIVHGTRFIEGELSDTIHASDSIWTLEDKKFLRICLLKTNKAASNCWRSLLVGQYEVNAYIHDKMQQKLTLQKFQFENPGMDFSGATVTGNYQGGGPDLPS